MKQLTVVVSTISFHVISLTITLCTLQLTTKSGIICRPKSVLLAVTCQSESWYGTPYLASFGFAVQEPGKSNTSSHSEQKATSSDRSFLGIRFTCSIIKILLMVRPESLTNLIEKNPKQCRKSQMEKSKSKKVQMEKSRTKSITTRKCQKRQIQILI